MPVALWNLRTHPFRPTEDPGGAAFSPELLLKPLDPTREPRALRFYFDCYEWTMGKLLEGLAPDIGLKRFPDEAELDDGPLLVIISGGSRSGRSSLLNLVLHRIISQPRYARLLPLTVDIHLSGYNHAENMKYVARLFRQMYAKEFPGATAAGLESIYNEEVKEDGRGNGTRYMAIFERFRLHIREECHRPIIFNITGVDDFDVLQVAFNSTRRLAQYVVMTMSRCKHAETGATNLSKSNKVAWIRARPMDLADALRYAQERIAAERTAPFHGADAALAPFSKSALEALYEKGATASAGEGVDHSIDWLSKRLRRALDDHLKKVAGLGAAAAGNLRIDAAAMRLVYEAMNQGR